MHLKSLELTGFKSFAEARIAFPKGITAVVGPNGTGKSNVVDAILWVLGEQSTKTLRSERMEDVIFNGTEARKPLGMAEVSLVIGGIGEERLAGLETLPNRLNEYDEVMVTRRLYRNGDSEYLINKTPCRLKDIRSLLLDTRAGTKGHTVIEQGRIEQILNASPQDRRELIEETAGIVRYKKQKAEALRKLEATRQNLLRVRDIIVEVRRQLNSLERQARQARTYQSLQQEAKVLEIRLLVRDCRALLASKAMVESDLAQLDAKEAGQAAGQARLNSELEAVRLRLVAGDESVSQIREELARVEHQQAQAVTAAEVERGRLELYKQQRAQALVDSTRLGREHQQVAADLAELRTKLSRIDADIAEGSRVLSELEQNERALAARRAAAVEEEERARQGILDITVRTTHEENNLARLEAQREEARRRADRLAEEQAEVGTQRADSFERLRGFAQGREEAERLRGNLQREKDAAAQETQRLEDRLRDTEQQVGRQQEEHAASESRVRALQGVIREEMGYGREGEGETASLRDCQGVREAVAEWLVVPPGLERAIEALLGERVRAWLVDGPAQARQAIAFLKTKELGRGAFIPMRPRVGEPGHQGQDWWPALANESGVVGQALDLVQAPDASRAVLTYLFEGVVIVETLEVAVRLWERGLWSAPTGPTLVTLAGDVLDAAGVMTGGAIGASGGLLQRRSEVQQLAAQLAQLARAVEDGRRSREQLSVECEGSRAAVQRLDESIRKAEMRLLALVKDEAGQGQSVEGLDKRIETISAERRMVEEERVQFEAEIRSGRDRRAGLVEEKRVQEAGLSQHGAALAGMEEEGFELQRRLTEAHLAVATLRARREHGEADLARLVKEQEERSARIQTLDQQIDALVTATQQSQAAWDRNVTQCQELGRRAVQIRAEFVSAQEAQAGDTASSRRVEQELSVVREAMASSREARTALEVRRAEINTQLATQEATLAGTYQLSLSAALAQEPEDEGKGQMTRERGGGEDDSRALREQLQALRERLQRMGLINLAAIGEHQELEERYRFLTTQEADLFNSVGSLKEIIARINRTSKQMFMDTFNELQGKFNEVFGRLFPGGRAELVLTEPEQGQEEGVGSSEEPGVDIVAQPPGKRLKSIAMLSGGEKTLTAMALIFASFLIRPTPFCILDEIDAPLDEENIGRFAEVLRELAEEAQFVVITHNKRTMGVADSLFGVTMEDPGISKLVSVRLAELQPV